MRYSYNLFCLFIVLILNTYSSFSQDNNNSCGTDAMHRYRMEHDSSYAAKINAINNYWQQYQNNNINSRILSDTIITIPIVVHIIHTNNANGQIDNPSDAQVIAMITELNKTFSATSSNYPNVNSGGVDTKIQFALAKRTPTCGATSGILRVNAGNLPKYVSNGVQWQFFGGYDSIGCGIGISKMMSISPLWPTDKYYNLYLVRGVCNGAMAFAQFGGYAVCPSDGSLLPHETGHYLYLYHTFEGANGSTCPPNTDCANTGDLVCDTDPELSGSCSATENNPCTGRAYGNVANNFMSYSCTRKFTQGQKQRMRFALEDGYNNLIYSLGAQSPSTVVPTITISQYYGSNPSCADSTIKFKAIYSNNLGHNPQLSWYINSNGYYGNADSLVLSASYINNNDTIYCSVTSTNQCVSPNPKFSNKIVVKRNPRVRPTISIALISGSNPSCDSSLLSFSSSITYGGTNPKYRWKINGVVVGQNSTFSSNALRNGDYIVCQLISNENCITDSVVTSGSIYIYRNPKNKPTIALSLLNGQNPSCQNSSLTFKATPTYGGTNPIYQWKVNNTNVGTNSSNYTTSSINTNDSVTCQLTSNENCISTNIVISRAFYVQRLQNVSPTVNISTFPSGTSLKICQGANINFQATVNNVFLNPSYQWKVNSGNVGTNSNYFSTSTLNNNDIIQCSIVSNDACVINRNASSNTLKVQVLPKITPSLSIQNLTNNDSSCIGDIVKLKAIPSNAGTSPTFLWFLTYNSTKDTISDIISIGNKTYYCAMLIDTSRYCSNTPLVNTSRTIRGEIKPPKPSITQISNYLKSSSTIGNQWYSVGSGKITGATNQNFTPVVNGKYYTVVTKNKCSSLPSDTITISNLVTSVTGNQNNNLDFQIYPNPNSGSFNLNLNKKLKNRVVISIYNMLGELVYKEVLESVNSKELTINTSININGLYNVIIENNDQYLSKKIQITK